jgi:hypothetical protein
MPAGLSHLILSAPLPVFFGKLLDRAGAAAVFGFAAAGAAADMNTALQLAQRTRPPGSFSDGIPTWRQRGHGTVAADGDEVSGCSGTEGFAFSNLVLWLG